MHKDTEDNWTMKQNVHIIVVCRVSINLNAHDGKWRPWRDELREDRDGLCAESDGRGFIRAAAEAVEGVPREAAEVAGFLLSSSLRICTRHTGSDS